MQELKGLLVQVTNEEAIAYFKLRIKIIESKPRYRRDDLNDIKQCDEDDYFAYHSACLAIKALKKSGDNDK